MTLLSHFLPDAETRLLTYPMHGQHKLLSEGYRTRDGHLIEWFGKHLGSKNAVAVVSRPEPYIALKMRRPGKGLVAENTYPVTFGTSRMPNPFNMRDWWVRSRHGYGIIPDSLRETPAVVWNPFVAMTKMGSNPFSGSRKTVMDLLDDWSIHYAFQGINKEVERAYAEAFSKADFVTANAEGTVSLAKRFGRDDVIFLPNGVDAHKFDVQSNANGNTKVGYLGKIGKRVDLELVLNCADSLPGIDFVFAGPILDPEYKAPLSKRDNIVLLGDVHYDDVPALLSTFDIGWVPHRVGEGEVGGDVMKTYEYRAAHLPVLTTPVAGAKDRGLNSVHVVDASAHKEWISDATVGGGRIARVPGELPINALWSTKAANILESLGLCGNGDD